MYNEYNSLTSWYEIILDGLKCFKNQSWMWLKKKKKIKNKLLFNFGKVNNS